MFFVQVRTNSGTTRRFGLFTSRQLAHEWAQDNKNNEAAGGKWSSWHIYEIEMAGIVNMLSEELERVAY
jgi:hypothetical protein